MEGSGQSQAKSRTAKIVSKIFPYVLVAIVAAISLAYIVKLKPQVLGLSKGTQDIQVETDKLISDIGKIMILPSDEKPTIATVTDLEKVKDQAFFKNAKNGDKVLIYTNAKKVILFRPSENRIIEVGAVNINQGGEASPVPSPSASPVPTSTPEPESGN